jgi:hypothetical protein
VESGGFGRETIEHGFKIESNLRHQRIFDSLGRLLGRYLDGVAHFNNDLEIAGRTIAIGQVFFLTFDRF